ncbi:MAG: lytic murein transglycosylase B [Herminiimonas sp.]|nr:lytic murein transglycosylase B [Herminiimonas sp.]
MTRLAALIILGLSTAMAAAQTAAPRAARTAPPDTVGEFANFGQWQGASEFIDQVAARDGFGKPELQAWLKQAQYVDSAVQLMKPAPPGRPKNWTAYRLRFVEPVRINAGVTFWNENAEALARAEARFGVPAEIIVGIIGVETVYGRNTGNFRVMDAITTLAFAYPNTPNREARMAYFRKELENTLLFAREANIDPFSLTGSYAGAIGWPQFMPGSIRQFAIDFDGDGRVDLRNSPVDAIGSVANFLVQHGWRSGDPIVFPTSAGAGSVPALPGAASTWQGFIGQGLEATYTTEDLRTGGVIPAVPLPADLRYGLIDLQNGGGPTEYWIATNNFYAITQYNRSYFYAMSVVDLGRAVRVARGRQ